YDRSLHRLARSGGLDAQRPDACRELDEEVVGRQAGGPAKIGQAVIHSLFGDLEQAERGGGDRRLRLALRGGSDARLAFAAAMHTTLQVAEPRTGFAGGHRPRRLQARIGDPVLEFETRCAESKLTHERAQLFVEFGWRGSERGTERVS